MGATLAKSYRNASATNTKVLVQAGNFNIVGWNLINPDAADSAYLKIYNAASIADVTLGTTAPVETLLIPFGPGTGLLSNEQNLQIACPLGIVYAVTLEMADSGTSAPTTACYVGLRYLPNQ